MNETAQTAELFVETRFLRRILKTLGVALLVCVSVEIWEANEEVLRGQVYGMEATAGAWVGVTTGETAYRSSQFVPYDKATIARERSESPNWTFTVDGEFELRSSLDENSELIVISKNRITAVVSIERSRPVQPLNVHLSHGLELKGTVRDVNGAAISGASISMTPLDKINEIPSFALPTWGSARDGSFHVAGLEARGYVLSVSAEDYAPVVVHKFVIPETGINQLEIELVPGYYVTGQVISETGTPVSNLKISSSWTRSYTKVLGEAGVLKVVRAGQFGWHFPRTSTLEDGTFKLGPFEIATNGSIWANSQEFGSARMRELYAPRSDLLLRLTREKVQGRVLDADTRKPIEQILVTIFRPGGIPHEVRPNDGYFELAIHPLDSEDTAILIDSQGYFPWIGRLYQGSTGIYDIDSVLLEKERTLRGIVRNGETGKPIEGVRILRNTEQYADTSIKVFLFNWRQRHRTITNEKGEFLVKKLSRGADRLDVISPSGGQQAVDIPADVEEFNIDLHFNGVIEGSLVLPDGRTVEGEVRLWDSTTSGSRTVVTSEGVFRLQGLPPDTYTLGGDSDAGRVQSRTVTLEAGQRLSGVEIPVRTGWSAEGVITGLKGNERVEITVRNPDARVLIRKWFKNGPYTVHGIPKRRQSLLKPRLGFFSLGFFATGTREAPRLTLALKTIRN